ncbi:MAG: ATP-binding protein [Bacteroidales bacterium]|nr:ATP-binding protein [Bacteroidales bacterium]
MKILQNDLPKENWYYFDLEDSRFKSLFEKGIDTVIAYLKQKGLAKYDQKTYLFVDEIQYLSNPSSFLKLTHDHHQEIKLIVSGSSSFEIKSKFKDTLVGRTVSFELFPLDFEEFLWFKQQKYNLKKRIDNDILIDELNNLYREYVLFGGYPKIVLTKNIKVKEKYLQQIIDTYVKGDIRDLANIRHIDKFNKLLHVLANQTGQLLNVLELANTTKIARQTVEDYLFILQQTYVLKLIHPFSGNIRSELFKTPKIFFYDTGLMNMLSQKYLPGSIDGNVFETAVFSDLIKNFGQNNINHWRTMDKKEIDFILSTTDDAIPIEVKLNASQLKYTALKYFSQKYNPKHVYCISLKGELPKRVSLVEQMFPWEIYKKLKQE